MNRLHFICFGVADIVHHPPQLLGFQRKPILLHTNAMNNTCAFNVPTKKIKQVIRNKEFVGIFQYDQRCKRISSMSYKAPKTNNIQNCNFLFHAANVYMRVLLAKNSYFPGDPLIFVSLRL